MEDLYQRIPHFFNHDRNQANPYRPCMVYLATFTLTINPYMDGMGDVTGKSRLVKYLSFGQVTIFTSYPLKKMGRHQYGVGAGPVFVKLWRPQKTTGSSPAPQEDPAQALRNITALDAPSFLPNV